MRARFVELLSIRWLRRLAIAGLLIVPLLTLWNLAVATYAPSLQVKLGRLRGVTVEPPRVPLTLESFIDGRAQDWIMDRVADALPVRPLMIRLSNQFRYRLFGAYGAPGVVAGAGGNLIEQPYLDEYCARALSVLEAKSADALPKIRELQSLFEERSRIFIYFTTPSKAAYMPEAFFPRIPCASSERDRREYLPRYASLLAKAGIHTVEAASLTHGLRGRYDVELFPVGGVHWNALGVAHAADALLAEINRQAGREIAPRLSWTYEVTDRPTGTDTDLIDVVNLLFSRPRYPTAKVTYAPPAKPCAEWPAAHMKIALVGGSFIHDVARALIAAGCLHGLHGYNYLYRSIRGGPGYVAVQSRVTPKEAAQLRDFDILILEENESVLPGYTHTRELHRVILGK